MVISVKENYHNRADCPTGPVTNCPRYRGNESEVHDKGPYIADVIRTLSLSLKRIYSSLI